MKSENAADWLTTHSGRSVDPFNVDVDDVIVDDIVHALPLINRFNGHTDWPYSVAQHSLFVAALVRVAGGDIRAERWGLLHDAHEIYLCDLPTPLKSRVPNFVAAELKAQRSVAEKFDLSWPIPECVHAADKVALATEWIDLRSGIPAPAALAGVVIDSRRVVPQDPNFIRVEFLREMIRLGIPGAKKEF